MNLTVIHASLNGWGVGVWIANVATDGLLAWYWVAACFTGGCCCMGSDLAACPGVVWTDWGVVGPLGPVAVAVLPVPHCMVVGLGVTAWGRWHSVLQPSW